MGTVARGAKQAVETCLRVKPGEKVVIITDSETMKIGYAIWQAAEKIVGNIHFFVMEDFVQRPLSFPDEIGDY